MKVLVGCEESQAVCKAFRAIGHEAYSCDIQLCSGGHPEWHILTDVFQAIYGGFQILETGKVIHIEEWDLLIAHPPCTYLSVVANRAHSQKCTDIADINNRTLLRIDAMKFFMELITANIDKIAIENPVGVMSSVYRKPEQIINPWQFADSEDDVNNYVTKKTCLWLKNLPLLKPTNCLDKPDNEKMFGRSPHGSVYCWTEKAVHGSKNRSKTFPGIAKAMAEQWGR